MELQNRLEQLKQKLRDDAIVRSQRRGNVADESPQLSRQISDVGEQQATPSSSGRPASSPRDQRLGWLHHESSQDTRQQPDVMRLSKPHSGGNDTAELDALRTQVESFRGMVSQAEARAAQTQRELDAAQQEVRRLRGAHESATQKISILKEQLMSGQEEAEQASQHHLSETLRQAREEHARELRQWQQKVEDLQARMSVLQRSLQTVNTQLADASSHAAHVPGLEERSQQLQQAAEHAEARAAAAEKARTAAESALAAKDTELSNLQAAIGELTYEAESAGRAQLLCRQLQARLDAAEAAQRQARVDLDAQQLQLQKQEAHAMEQRRRCEAAEAQCAALFEEGISLRGELAGARQHVQELQGCSISAESRRRIVELIRGICTRRVHALDAVAELSGLLALPDAEQAALLQSIPETSGANRGLLTRVARLPVRLLQGLGAPNQQTASTPQDGNPSIAADWATFLMEGETRAPSSPLSDRTHSASAGRLAANDEQPSASNGHGPLSAEWQHNGLRAQGSGPQGQSALAMGSPKLP